MKSEVLNTLISSILKLFHTSINKKSCEKKSEFVATLVEKWVIVTPQWKLANERAHLKFLEGASNDPLRSGPFNN